MLQVQIISICDIILKVVALRVGTNGLWKLVPDRGLQ